MISDRIILQEAGGELIENDHKTRQKSQEQVAACFKAVDLYTIG